MTKEDERYSIQQILDSGKTDKERNILGQFSTPYSLAKDMVNYVLKFRHDDNIAFLEPAIGTGVFFSALLNTTNPIKATGFEIDPYYFNPTKNLWNEYNIDIINSDFFKSDPKREFNLILANPPYTRHHHVNANTKKELQARVLKEYNLRISGLSGLYCYFLILSTLWLKEDGLSSWLIPSEFLDVNYGSSIKEFLCSKVELISIHRFNPADLQFSDALVSSSIVTFRNSNPKGQKIRFSTGPRINNPETSIEISLSDLNPRDKWSLLFDTSRPFKSENGKCLGEYFKVSRGVSTGNNDFFIIPDDFVAEKRLPMEYLTPVLPAPRHLRTEIIKTGLGSLDKDNRYYLLSCPLPIDIIESRYPNLFDYIKDGEKKKMNSGHNCQKRSPWYMCEKRKPAPIYMTYMGRNNANAFRFILNESDAIVTNSYLMLYPKANYAHCFMSRKTVETVWEILNRIPKSRLAECGRCYGGGLLKIEPKELEALVVPELYDILTPQQKSIF